jgi:hypothetical protein
MEKYNFFDFSLVFSYLKIRNFFRKSEYKIISFNATINSPKRLTIYMDRIKDKKRQKKRQNPNMVPSTVKREVELKEFTPRGAYARPRAVALATSRSPGRRAAGGRRERRAFPLWG